MWITLLVTRTRSAAIIAAVSLFFVVQFEAVAQVSLDLALVSGQRITRSISGIETHRYLIELNEGEFFQVRVEQKGVDLALKLMDSHGKTLATMDSPNSTSGPEILSFVGDQNGRHVLEIGGFEATSRRGTYTISRSTTRIATTTDKRRVEVESLFVAGMAAQETKGQTAVAIAKFAEALRGWRELEDDYLTGLTLNQVDFLLSSLDEKQLALENLRQLLIHLRSVGDRWGEALTLTNIGHVFDDLGEGQKALECFSQARPLWNAIGDKWFEARTLSSIGGKFSDLGEYRRALDYYNQALSLRRAIGDRRGEATVLHNIGHAYKELGEYHKSLEHFIQARPIFGAVGDRSGEAAAIGNIGSVYNELGNSQRALENFEQALVIFREAGDPYGEAGTLALIGREYLSQGKNRQALDSFNKSLTLRIRVRDRWGEATTLNNIGSVYNFLDKKQQALKYYEQALAILRTVGYRSGEAAALNNIGAVYGARGEKQKELKYYHQALLLLRAVGNQAGEAKTLGNIMLAWNALGNRPLASLYGKLSVNVYQDLRANIKSLETSIQQTYLGTIDSTYKKLADILIADGRFAEAQEVLSLVKEREYFDYVRRDPDEIKALGTKAKLRVDEQNLIARYEKIAGRVASIGAEFEKLDEQKRKLPDGAKLRVEEQRQYEELTAQLSDANAAFKLFLEKELVAEFGKAVKREIDVDRALQEKLRSWGGGTVALYTVAGEDRYRVIMTTPTVQVDGKTEIKAAELNKKIFAFREALQRPRIDPRPLGKELYDILLKPIEKDLAAANAKTIIWSLDGTLRYVPVAALSPDGKNYLIERYRSAVITSATRDSLSAAGDKRWQMLGLGVTTTETVVDPLAPDRKLTFPALPGVRQELSTIVRDELGMTEKGLLPGRRLLDKEFNTTNFADLLTKETEDKKRKFTVIHIASHFRLGDDTASSFLLTGNGALTLEEISNSPQMRFGDVELVTLSACNTAFGSDSTGKEVDSLATFIETRGARSILATLWPVADESTQLLMTEFYRLKKEFPEMTKSEAMQRAQLSMIEGRLAGAALPKRRAEIVGGLEKASGPEFVTDDKAPFAHPYYWAPFVLIGNWK